MSIFLLIGLKAKIPKKKKMGCGGVITRTGVNISSGQIQEYKKELTVRPIVNGDFGFPPPAFRVFKPTKTGICVPRFYAEERVGKPVEDKRPRPARIDVKFQGRLRTSTRQVEAFDRAIEAGHGVLSLPCGYGKTTVALAIASKLGYRTMIIVHKQFLADQWRERINQFVPGASVGVIQQEKLEVECDFAIAMLQSLSLKEYSFSDFESFGTVIVDEAHHVCAKVFSQALFKMCPRHIYGLSATPERRDGLTKILHWFMGPTFFAVERKNQDGVEVFPTPFECEMFKGPPPTARNGKISLASMETELVEMRERNVMLVNLIKKASAGSRQLLVLSSRRWHCEHLHQCFQKTSGLYMGGMKASELEESSKKKIIFATFSQAHEGLDIPTLDTVILATPKSDIVQSIGRIMRETKGKLNNPHIYDVVDQWSILHAMYYKRLRVYKKGGFRIHSLDDDEESVTPRGEFLFKI